MRSTNESVLGIQCHSWCINM